MASAFAFVPPAARVAYEDSTERTREANGRLGHFAARGGQAMEDRVINETLDDGSHTVDQGFTSKDEDTARSMFGSGMDEDEKTVRSQLGGLKR